MKKHWPYFLIVFLIPVITILWWWGLFSSAKVETGERGDYYYAYLDAEGPYSKLTSTQNEVLFVLKQQGIEAGAQITLILSDPRTTPYKELKARTGFIIDKDKMPAAPLKIETIPIRKVAVAEIKAHPLFAYGKAYSALIDYSEDHKTTLHLPTLEIVESSVLHVEMPLAEESLSAKVLWDAGT
ncbi:MAG: AraC family transcriptional regulator [Nitrosomonadales bacterium]|nr:AraC family transcriptional regulator [Nitrosomonadales bacterium]